MLTLHVFYNRVVFYREKAAGMYSSNMYALAYMMAEVPWFTLCVLIFYVIVFFASQVADSFQQGLLYLLPFWLFVTMCTFLSHLITAISPNYEVANALGPGMASWYHFFPSSICTCVPVHRTLPPCPSAMCIPHPPPPSETCAYCRRVTGALDDAYENDVTRRWLFGQGATVTTPGSEGLSSAATVTGVDAYDSGYVEWRITGFVQANQAPLAVDDTVTTVGNWPSVINVLVNDVASRTVSIALCPSSTRGVVLGVDAALGTILYRGLRWSHPTLSPTLMPQSNPCTLLSPTGEVGFSTLGGGVGKGAQLTGPFSSYYELWCRRRRKFF